MIQKSLFARHIIVDATRNLLMDVKALDEVVRGLDKSAKSVNPEKLTQCTRTVQATANNLCEGSENKIVFKYINGKKLVLTLKNTKSKDCLIKAIETHFNSMPFFTQAFFSLLRYRLTNL